MTTDAFEIFRDTDGIAHIRSATVSGTFAGQGYAAATDRLWQLESDRRRAMGCLAAIVGPTAIVADTFHRRLGIAEAARRSLDALTDETVAMLDAYAAGVNRAIADIVAADALPPEFALLGARPPEPWEAWHSIALYEVRHLAMGTWENKTWRSGLLLSIGAERLAALWPDIEELCIDPEGTLTTVAQGAAEALAAGASGLGAFVEEPASNNLVIGPSRTATGAPILAGDPHRAIDLPNVYWQNQITCTADGSALDDGFDAIGLSFPGVPGFPHFGHTAGAAWCITHGMADDQDVYVVTSADGWRTHRHGGIDRPAGRRTEALVVAGSDDVEIEIITTAVGPIVAGTGATRLAMTWTATWDLDTTFDALVPMVRAQTIDDLDTAFIPWIVPVNNVLLADTTGAIGYRMRGRVAVRGGVGPGANGWVAVDGSDPARAWTGVVADADLARWRDPEAGFLVTSNNRIDLDGPYISHDWAHPARSRRLTDRLSAETRWDVDDVAALLGDTHSAVSVALAERLRAVPAPQAAERAATALLDGWAGHMDADSPAAALIGVVRAELVGLVALHLGLHDDRVPGIPGPSIHQTERFVNSRLGHWLTDSPAVDGLVPDEALTVARRQAVRRLELSQGTDPTRWRWDVEHPALFIHPLAALRPDLADRLPTPPAVGLGGDTECVWATSTAPPSTKACNAQVARYVMDVGDWDRSGWVVPHGVSADPRSPHHVDQLDDWTAMRLRPMRFSSGAVDAATEAVQYFEADGG